MNALLNLCCNIVIPIFLLNKMSSHWGPILTLIIALLFPVGFGLFEYFYHHKRSMISVLGIINVLISGGFTLLHLGGAWFALKEALFPMLIGVFVFLSPYFKQPFIESLFLNPEVMNAEIINQAIAAKGQQEQLKKLVIRCNQFFALSFVLSGVINYFLAIGIFIPFDSALSEVQKSEILNTQLAEMHSKGFLFLAIPSLVISMALLFYFLNRLEILTGVKKDDLLKS